MRILRKMGLLVALLCGLCLPGQAQGPREKALLWKISGPEGAAPSYLMGTLPLADERALLGGERLLEALRHTEQFATEMDPDSVMGLVFDQNRMEGRQLALDYDQQQVLNYGMEKLLSNGPKPHGGGAPPHLLLGMSLEVGQAEQPSPMLLRHYLHGQAKQAALPVHSLEPESQRLKTLKGLDWKGIAAELRGRFFKEGDPAAVSLLGLYQKQDIRTLYLVARTALQQPEGLYERLIPERNARLAENLGRLITEKPTFAAVNVLHLGGPQGLVARLQKAGYELEPVPIEARIDYQAYLQSPSQWPWHTFESAQHGYRLSFPGKLFSHSDLFSEGGLQVNVYVDLSRGNLFGVSVSILAEDQLAMDDFSDRLEDKFEEAGFEDLEIETKEFRGNKAYELVGSRGKGRLRMLGILKGQAQYLLMIGGSAADPANADAKRFIQSFEFREIQADQGTYRDLPEAALRYWSPVALSRAGSSRSGDYRFKVYQGSDPQSGRTLELLSMQPTADYYFPDDSVLMRKMMLNYLDLDDQILQDSSFRQPGMSSRLVVTENPQGRIDWYRLTIRGNRLALLHTQNSEYPTASRRLKDFLMKVEAQPWPQPQWERHAFDSLGLSVEMPGQPEEVGGGLYPYLNQITHSHASSAEEVGAYYRFYCQELSPYYHSPSPDSLAAEYSLALETTADSLEFERVGDTVFRYKGRRWYRERYAAHKGQTLRQHYITQAGGFVYRFFVQGPRELAGTPHFERFWQSARFSDTGSFHPYRPKDQRFLHDLASKDQALADSALDQWEEVRLRPAQYPEAYRLLMQAWPDDTALTGSRRLVLLDLLEAHPDTSHVAALEKWLASDPPAHMLEPAAEVLDGIASPQAPRVWCECLRAALADTGKRETDFSLLSLEDQARELLPCRQALLQAYEAGNNKASLGRVIDTLQALGEWSAEQQEQIAAQTAVFLRDNLAQATEKNFAKHWRLQQRFNRIRSAGQPALALELVEEAEATKNRMAYEEALAYRWQHGLSWKKRYLRRMARDPYYRSDALKLTRRYGKESELPGRFSSAKAVAEGLVYEQLSTQHGRPEKIRDEAEIFLSGHGKSGRLFFFKVRYELNEGSKKWFLVHSGLQPRQGPPSLGGDYISEKAGNYPATDAKLEELLTDFRKRFKF